MGKLSYVLITPARNEDAYITKVVESVISQTILPKRWIIASDGSTDHTDEVVSKYVAKYDFIQLVHTEGDESRNFGSKVKAHRMGYEQLRGMEYDFIGNLDADVSFAPNYYEKVLEQFQQNPRLGIAGGITLQNYRGRFERSFDTPDKSVAGPIQLFRRQCYEEIGGFILIRLGGEDSAAEIMARMHEWEVRSFPELEVLHHRRTGTEGTTIWRARFRQGEGEYLLGYHPLFHVAKCSYRVIERPYLLGSVLRVSGYCWSSLRREKRVVSADFVKHLRREQMHRLKSLFSIFTKMV